MTKLITCCWVRNSRILLSSDWSNCSFFVHNYVHYYLSFAGPIYNGSERKSNSLNVKTKSEFRADFFYISNIRLKILDLN